MHYYSRPRYVGYDVVDIEWDFTHQEFDDFPQSPADNVAISFRPDHYAPTNAREEWVYYGKACADPSGIDSKTAGGAVCAWRDYQDWDTRSYFGVRVEPNWETYTEWERRVYVDFVHTWSGYGLTGVSVGLGGLSMGFSEDTDRWDVEDSAAEARLVEGKEIGVRGAGGDGTNGGGRMDERTRGTEGAGDEATTRPNGESRVYHDPQGTMVK